MEHPVYKIMRSKPQLSIIKGPQQDINPCSLHKLFENNLLQHSTKPALIFNDRTLTYKEVNERSNQYARVILRDSLERCLNSNQDGDYVIAICMEPSDNLVMVLLAVWKAGAAYLPIDPGFPSDRINHIINETRPMMVICDNDIDPKLFGSINIFQVNELNKDAVKMDVNNISDSQMLQAPKDLAIVNYTSGSTGVPKGVRLPHAVILNRLKWQWVRFPFTSDESVGVSKTSLTFLDSVSEIWSPLLNGLTLLVVPKATTKDPEKLVKLLDDNKVGRIVLVPTLLRNILMYLRMNCKTHNTSVKLLSNLRNWVCSGEPLQKQLVEQFFEYFEEGKHTLHNFYGCTEVMADVLYFTCESRKQLNQFEQIPIGLPISNTLIYILDEDYRPVTNGEIGEIFVAGLNIADGYVNGRDPHRFIENPFSVDNKFSRLYNTGDFGSFRKGNIHFEGRTDSQIKIRGHRVDLTEVEKTILSIDDVEKAIVLCHHVDQIDRVLLAFVQLNNSSSSLTGLQLEESLKKKLQDYMLPQVMIIDEVPLMINGKTDQQALLSSYETAITEEIPFDLSQVPDDLKQIASDIFNIVKSVIKRSARGTLTMDSNFYEMGGNSLNSIITITLLREKGYQIDISDFISAKNLGEIIYKLANKSTTADRECRLPILNLKSFPLTNDDKEDFIEILTDSFFDKGGIGCWIQGRIQRNELSKIFEAVWVDAIAKGYSFRAKDMATKKTIGVAVNFDARDQPKCKLRSLFADRASDMVELVEASFSAEGLNKVIYAAFEATSTKLSPQENIACIHFMEEELIKLAKRENFLGVFVTNSNPLTQQLATDVFKYRCLVNYQVNKYIQEDGTSPFERAPDSQKLMVHYKEL